MMYVGKYGGFALVLSTAHLEVTNVKVGLSCSKTLTTAGDRNYGSFSSGIATLHEISC